MTAPLGYGYEFEGAVELEPMLAGTDAPNGHSFRPRRSSVGLTGTLRAPSDSYAVPAWRPSSPPPPPGGPGESPSERGLVGFLRPARNRAASDFDRFGLLLLVDSDGDVDVEAENSEPAEGEPQVCGITGTGGGAFEAPTGLPALSVACEGRERMKSYQMSELSQGSRSKSRPPTHLDVPDTLRSLHPVLLADRSTRQHALATRRPARRATRVSRPGTRVVVPRASIILPRFGVADAIDLLQLLAFAVGMSCREPERDFAARSAARPASGRRSGRGAHGRDHCRSSVR